MDDEPVRCRSESRQAFLDWFEQRSGPWLSCQAELRLVCQAGVDWALSKESEPLKSSDLLAAGQNGKDIQAIVGQATNVATQRLSLPQTTKPASGWKAHVQLTLAVSR